MISVDISRTGVEAEVFDLGKQVKAAHKRLRTNKASDCNVWVELPKMITEKHLARISEKAEWVRKNSDVLAVVGIGGSYAGAAAAIDVLGDGFPVEFVSLGFDTEPLEAFFKKYKDKNVTVNIISKSGNTMEIVAATQEIENFMRGKYSAAECKKRMIWTTGVGCHYECGSCRQEDSCEKPQKGGFNIPDGVGGRFSVLTAVGYLPMAVAGIDIFTMHAGASVAYDDLDTCTLEDNAAYLYAATRNLLHSKRNKDVEILASFYQSMERFGQWWQQLFGESEGKEGKGIFPSPMVFTRDLHSMGQFVQQGKSIMFETIIDAAGGSRLNKAATMGTVRAHADAGVPVVVIKTPKIDAKVMGYLFYFFEIACAMSAYLLDVNPFDQPGVEYYKRNMREELAKPVLLIMAAGMGSRFGGIKQIEAVGDHGETIIDYSIYDAMLAGFRKVVFVIRREIEKEFCERFFNRIKEHIECEYVFQDFDDLPDGLKTPESRKKPWGTTHAVLAARDVINSPFCVINADDFYGRSAYAKVVEFFKTIDPCKCGKFALVGYELKNTVSEHGTVSRGIIECDEHNFVVAINERKKVRVKDGTIGYEDDGEFCPLSQNASASMTFFGFTPDVLPMLQNKFESFIRNNINDDKAESIIAQDVGDILKEGKASMRLFESADDWHGFTYMEDKDKVKAAIKKLVDAGQYPSPLWKVSK